MKFTLHTNETAPEASGPVLDQVERTYGFVPNLYAVFAESPVAISTYLHLSGQLKAHGALSPQEQQIAMLAVSETNGCDYCVAAHSAAAMMSHVPKETIEALRDGREPSEPKQSPWYVSLKQCSNTAVGCRRSNKPPSSMRVTVFGMCSMF